MSQCPSEEQLAGHVGGVLTEEEDAAIRSHAEQCAQCRGWIAQNRNDADWVDNVFGNARSGFGAVAETTAVPATKPSQATHGSRSGQSSSSRERMVKALIGQGILVESTDPTYMAELGALQDHRRRRPGAEWASCSRRTKRA